MNSELISVVVPCFKCANSVKELVGRLHALEGAAGLKLELVLVDDCSPDDTWTVMKTVKENTHGNLKIIRLSRNSGQHNALLCGMLASKGDIVVTMDDDLQNPPEEVPQLLAAFTGNTDLVIGAYDKKQHHALKNLGGDFVDAVLRKLFKLPHEFQLTSFRAVRREVVNSACRMGGDFPYITAMLLSHSVNPKNVRTRHEPRKYGKSNYTLGKSLSLSLNLLLNYSSYPLYCVVALSVFAFLLAVGFGTVILTRTIIWGSSVPGWASTVVIVSLLDGLILLSLVIFGAYLSRLNQIVNQTRPRFIIREQKD